MAEAFIIESPRYAALRATNYSPITERFRRASLPTRRLRDLVSDLGGAYWAVFKRHDCAESCGVRLLSQTDMFASEPRGRIIRRDSMTNPGRHLIERWQILIAGTGQTGENALFGRSIIADSRLSGAYLSQHAVGLKFHEPGSRENLFTYAFLNTQAGVRALKAAAFGTSIPGLRLDLVGDLCVPFPDDATQEKIAALIRTAVQQRDCYLGELRAARLVIEDLPEMREAQAACAERRARCIVWDGSLPTMCAWNFASTGGALALLRRKWRLRLADVLDEGGLFKGGRMSRVLCSPPHGDDLLSQRDIFSIRHIPRRVVASKNDADCLRGTEGQLLVASRGQLTEGTIFGSIERASHGAIGKIVTEDIVRIVPSKGNEELAFAFLSTRVGHALLASSAFGTSIPGMRLDLVASIPFPDVDEATMTRVIRHVRACTAARQAADAAEAEAIRIVEEEVLPAWLS